MTSASSDVDARKADLRRVCSAVRDQLSPETKATAAARLAATGLGCVEPNVNASHDGRSRWVSAYSATGSELDPSPLLAALARDGWQTCLPVITPKGEPLLFRCWRLGDPLRHRMWGIREPEAQAMVVEPDVLLVPLLAFDADGWRLGYGGGYYDRTLARLRALKPIVAIGIAFDEQEVAAVPRDGFDQRLDWILTPAGPRRVNP